MSFEEDFLYPIIIAISSIVVSGLFTHSITQKYQNKRQSHQNQLQHRQREIEIQRQDRQKELDVKRDLISQIAQSITNLTRVMSPRFCLIDDTDRRKTFLDWRSNTSIIGSMMRAYFSLELVKKWDELYFIATRFYVLFEEIDKDASDRLKNELIQSMTIEEQNLITKKEWSLIDTKFQPKIKLTDSDYAELKPIWNKFQKIIKDRKYDLIRDLILYPIHVFSHQSLIKVETKKILEKIFYVRDLSVSYEPRINVIPRTNEEKKIIDSRWVELQRISPDLFTKSLFHVVDYQFTGDKLELLFSDTNYKEFLVTHQDSFIKEFGMIKMSKPVSAGAIILTCDNKIVLAKRNISVHFDKGKKTVPSGWITDEDIDKTGVNIYNAVKREINKKISISENELEKLFCIGFIYNGVLDQYYFPFCGKTNLSLEEIQNRNQKNSKHSNFEFSEIIGIENNSLEIQNILKNNDLSDILIPLLEMYINMFSLIQSKLKENLNDDSSSKTSNEDL